MTHVFIVDETTFKYHLEYMFAGTGAKDNLAPFINNPTVKYHYTVERILVGMIADISRIRVGDKVIFYLQGTPTSYGMFFGVFKVASAPFFDENDGDNYLRGQTKKGLSFRVLIEPDTVYPAGITEHEFLDSLKGKTAPYDMCWSLIYRKLKAKRGCTMIMDYEFDDLSARLAAKNDGKPLQCKHFSFDDINKIIIPGRADNIYRGRRDSLDILNRLLHKAVKGQACETHLQAYIMQNFDKSGLSDLLLPLPDAPVWIGNEVSCGVGMQRIDVMIKQENATDVYIRLIELKYAGPSSYITESQIPWYLEWIGDYVIPKYRGKHITVIPTVIAAGPLTEPTLSYFKNFKYIISGAEVLPLQYIGYTATYSDIKFSRYL